MTRRARALVAGATDRGRVRAANEDAYAIAALEHCVRVRGALRDVPQDERRVGALQGHLLLVADGLGGHRHGAEASASAVDEVLSHVVRRVAWHDAGEVDAGLREAFLRSQADLARRASSEEPGTAMGTTLTAALVRWPRLHLAHVGDSRCYLRRGASLEQLTTDHTLARQVVEEGRMSAAEAEELGLGHVLLAALGGVDDEVDPDLSVHDLELGDELLLCSDGLGRHVPDAEVLDVLRAADAPEDACRELVARVNARGGEDNVTVVVARFVPDADADEDEHDEAPGEPADRVRERRLPTAGLRRLRARLARWAREAG